MKSSYCLYVYPPPINWTGLCMTLSLLWNGFMNTFPRQRRISGGVVFYTVRVVSKEIRRLVIPELLIKYTIFANYS
jgi:hypothetical protein